MDVTLSPRARTTVAWLLALAGVVVLFRAAQALAPFIWAVITAYILHPFVVMIQRRTRLPRALITVWVYLVIGLLFYLLFSTLAPQLGEQIDQLRRQTIPQMIDDIEGWVLAQQQTDGPFAAVDPGLVQERLDLLGEQSAELLSTEAVSLLLETFSFAIELFVYLFASFYLVVHGDRFVRTFRNFLSHRYHREADALLVEINATLGAFLRGQVVLVVIMSTVSYVALRILDVDYALSVAIATGFLELIPLIGPWSAGAIAVTIAFFQPTAPFGWSNLTLAIVVALVYFALRQLEDVFVIPNVIGRFVHLPPLLVIFVLVVGTTLGGPLGLILAVPAAAVLKIITGYFYRKLMSRETRLVEVVSSRESLAAITERFPKQTNATVVLLVEPGALDWTNLPLVQQTAAAALEHAVDLEVVTPDGVAGALATAAGIPTTTIPATAGASIPPDLSAALTPTHAAPSASAVADGAATPTAAAERSPNHPLGATT
jgi:predicted PurR-regulated permease PerM